MRTLKLWVACVVVLSAVALLIHGLGLAVVWMMENTSARVAFATMVLIGATVIAFILRGTK